MIHVMSFSCSKFYNSSTRMEALWEVVKIGLIAHLLEYNLKKHCKFIKQRIESSVSLLFKR